MTGPAEDAFDDGKTGLLGHRSGSDVDGLDQHTFFTGKAHSEAPFLFLKKNIYKQISIYVVVVAVEEFYVDNSKKSYGTNTFLSTAPLGTFQQLSTGAVEQNKRANCPQDNLLIIHRSCG